MFDQPEQFIKKDTPNYIQVLRQKLSAESSANFQRFVKSEALLRSVTSAVRTQTELELILQEKPETAKELSGIVLNFSNKSRKSINGFESEESQIHKNVTLLNKAISKEYSGVRNYFDKRVSKEAKKKAKILLQEALKNTENILNVDGQVAIVIDEKGLQKMLDENTYNTQLDRAGTNFSSFKPETQEQLKKMAQDLKESKVKLHDVDINGLNSNLAWRWITEIGLGIFPIDGEDTNSSHPCYGQTVVDLDKEAFLLEEQGYGNILLYLKSNNVRGKTVFAAGDTIGRIGEIYQFDWPEAIRTRFLLNYILEKPFVNWMHIPPYAEAHILGGIELTDIDRCVVLRKQNEHQMGPSITTGLNRLNIDLNYLQK